MIRDMPRVSGKWQVWKKLVSRGREPGCVQPFEMLLERCDEIQSPGITRSLRSPGRSRYKYLL